MTADLFDPMARRLRRDRSRRAGNDFLLGRAFDECIERLGAIERPVERLLLVGALNPSWSPKARTLAPMVTEFDLADPIKGDDLDMNDHDAAIVVGALETLNALPAGLQLIRQALKPDRPMLGAMLGGESLPRLRRALIEADRAIGGASARVHPRIDAPTLASLLNATGFVMPVVDVDRVTVRYSALDHLITDLRSAALTNQLAARTTRYPGKAWRNKLINGFAATATDKTAERFEFLHFLAWTPS